MIRDGLTLPCYFADSFRKPTSKTPYILVWFDNDCCLIFTLQVFIGRMTKIEDRYWIETDSFVPSSYSTKPEATSSFIGTAHAFLHAPNTQNPKNPSLSRFEIIPNAQNFCGKPYTLHSTPYSDLFVTYRDSFNMHT